MDTASEQSKYQMDINQHPGREISLLWQDCLRRVCDGALGRPISGADADRFQLVRKDEDYSRVGVVFDGHHIGTLTGEYVHRDGGVFYTVKFN